MTSIPLFVAYAEYDLIVEEHQALRMRDALCNLDRCPTLALIEGHSHMSHIYSVNTTDESLARPILAFLRAKR